MRVVMLTQISGFRDGVEWPSPGEPIDVPAPEAADLIHAGYAKEAPDAPTPEPAAVPEAEDGDAAAPAEDGDAPAETGPVVAPAKPAGRTRKAKA